MDKSFITKFMFIILLISFTASSILLSYSYIQKPLEKYAKKTVYARLSLERNTCIYVKPVLVYDYKPYIEDNTAFLSTVKYVEINVSLKPYINTETELGAPRSVEMVYIISSAINTDEWEKSFTLANKTIIENSVFKERLIINLTRLRDIVYKVSNEIGVRTYSYKYIVDIPLTIIVIYENNVRKTYSINPMITVLVDTERNRMDISFSNTDKTYSNTKEVVIENNAKLPLVSITIAELRRVSLYAAISLGMVLVFMGLIMFKPGQTEKTLEYYTKRYKKRVVPIAGISANMGFIVNTRSLREIFELAVAYKSPIFLDKDNCISTIVYNTLYRYCKELKQEEKEGSRNGSYGDRGNRDSQGAN